MAYLISIKALTIYSERHTFFFMQEVTKNVP
nr:MAG TPA: hypothetical protein [Bacteriophage sp.]